MTKILFVDLDGTIRQTKSGKTFITEPKDQQLIPGAMQALERYRDNNWLIVGITNQGGVPHYKSLQSCFLEQRITMVLAEAIAAVYFTTGDGQCWFVPKGDSNPSVCEAEASQKSLLRFRKPGTGMVELACDRFAVEPSVCLFAGDRPEDYRCASAAGVDFLWADRWRTS